MTSDDPAVLETRTPTDLNPWAGVAVLGLHSHIADEPCTDLCTEYPSTEEPTDA